MSNLSRLQLRLCEMLQFFHSFCLEHGLTYYAVAGTMLGAVRHKGFIPWDDDVDVCMPRDDYERLKTFTGLIDGKYVFETVDSPDVSYCYPFTKMYDTTTTLIANNYYMTKRGVYLDIFPIDGCGNTESEAQKNFDSIKFLKKFLEIRLIRKQKGRAAYKNAIIAITRAVPNWIISDKDICRKLDQTCKRFNSVPSLFGGGIIAARKLVPLSVFGTPVLYPFENFMIYGVEKYEEYLTITYGNWRQFPPPEKQISHHGYYSIDLLHSYME